MADDLARIRAQMRAQTVAGAMQVLGPQNEAVAEWVANQVMPFIESIHTAAAGVLQIDPLNPDPAAIAEQMRQHSEELVETAFNAIAILTVRCLGAGLRVGRAR